MIPTLLAAGAWMVSHDQAGSLELRMKEIRNNPDKFRVSVGNNTSTCFFTYDPRAADEWLFQTGGALETDEISLLRRPGR